MTKVAMEHLRHASALERLAADDWERIFDEVINAAEDDDQQHPGQQQQERDQEELAMIPEEESGDGQGDHGERAAEHRQQFHSTPSLPAPAVFPFPFPIGYLPTSTAPSMRAPDSAFGSRRESRRSSMEQQAVLMNPENQPPVSGNPETMAQADPLTMQQMPTTPADQPDGDGGGVRDDRALQPLPELPQHPVLPERPGDGEHRLDRAQSSVRRVRSEGAVEDRPGVRRRFNEPLRLGDRVIDALVAETGGMHPLVQAVDWAKHDVQSSYFLENDHGTFDGRWTRPSAWEFEAMQTLGWTWPVGSGGHETLTTAAQSKELQWSAMDEETRSEFRKAAADQWSKWVENEAIEMLSPEASRGSDTGTSSEG